MKKEFSRKEIINIMIKKENLYKTILFSILFISLIFSLLTFLIKNTSRKMFIFPSASDGKYIVEYRNLHKKPVQGDVHFFIDELLLGSQVERTKKLFMGGTKVLSCFQRGNVLYLNLSGDLLQADSSVIDIKEGVSLLDMNIKKNFPKIKTVEVFVEGKIAFEK